MNRLVGSLLLVGLGLCTASGCALSGTDRTNSFARRLPWASERQQRENSDGSNRESRDTVSFRAPSRKAETTGDWPTVSPGRARSEMAAATGQQTNVVDSNSTANERSLPSRNHSAIAMAGHVSDRTDLGSARNRVVPALAESIEPLPDEESAASNVLTAHYRSDRDAMENPVQLQGFETLAPSATAATTANPNDPPLWPNRPNSRPTHAGSNVEPPAALPSVIARHTDEPIQFSPGSGPVEQWRGKPLAGGLRGGHVQTVHAEATPLIPPSPWQGDVERLIAWIEQDVANFQQQPGSTLAAQAEYRRRQVHLRLLYLMAQRQEQALTAIPGLEPAEQEYWQQLCWAASNSLDAEHFPSPRERATQSIAPLNTALRRLREQSDLTIKNIAFCEQISYFGNYQKFARDEFTPGQEVLLYAEIENFNTDQTADGEHRTLLRSVIDIVGANGEARWHKTFPATEDRCRNSRRDYFHNYQFTIPDRLPLGPHTLKLTVVDDLSGKQASYDLNFLVK